MANFKTAVGRPSKLFKITTKF